MELELVGGVEVEVLRNDSGEEFENGKEFDLVWRLL